MHQPKTVSTIKLTNDCVLVTTKLPRLGRGRCTTAGGLVCSCAKLKIRFYYGGLQPPKKVRFCSCITAKCWPSLNARKQFFVRVVQILHYPPWYHAHYFTYRDLYGYDYREETRKPPPCTVTVFWVFQATFTLRAKPLVTAPSLSLL